MFSDFITDFIPFIICVLSFLFFRKAFEKISWKFLIPFLALFRLTDNLTTLLVLEKFNHNYNVETNRMVRWTLFNINLPDIVVLFLSEIIFVSFLSLIGWFVYRKWKAWRVVIKIIVFGFAIMGLLLSISNFLFYLPH